MDAALADTLAFVTTALGDRRRILEVGCGHGELAAALHQRGHAITALDRHLHAEHLPRGPRFVEQDFLTYEDAPHDAILFTTSLHHIAPLDAALDRARALLAPGGIVLIDDFDVAAPDEPTAAFWCSIAEPDVESASPPLERWRTHHDETPPLHTAAAMHAALVPRFTISSAAVGPYLYRYAHPVEDRDRWRSAEAAAITDGTVVAVGRRWLAELP
jgi:SAM-dependent methyltransferase